MQADGPVARADLLPTGAGRERKLVKIVLDKDRTGFLTISRIWSTSWLDSNLGVIMSTDPNKGCIDLYWDKPDWTRSRILAKLAAAMLW